MLLERNSIELPEELLDLKEYIQKVDWDEDWMYENAEKSYKLIIYLLNDNIIYIHDKGQLDQEGVQYGYQIFDEIIQFADTQKFFVICNMSNLAKVSRSAWNLSLELDKKYEKYWEKTFYIIPSIFKTIYHFFQYFNPGLLNNFTIASSVKEVFDELYPQALRHCQQKGAECQEVNQNNYPQKSYDELIQENERLRKELAQKDEVHNRKIHDICQVLGKITWDDDFDPDPLPKLDEHDPYFHLFNSVNFLQTDIYELLTELHLKNQSLEHEVDQNSQELMQKEANLSSLVDSSDDLICSFDLYLNVLVINKAMKKLIYQALQIKLEVGASLHELLHYKELIWIKLSLNDVFQGEAVRRHDFRIDDYEPETILDISINPIRDHDQNIIGGSFIAKIVTEHIKIDRKLREQNIELKKVNEELDRFVYSASHDLRAPIASALGLINISMYEENPGTIRNYLTLMKNSMDKLDNFIRDIVNYSWNSRLDIQLEKINMRELIWEVFDNYRFIKNYEEIQKEVIIGEQEIIHSDYQRVKIILNNLIGNALKYQRIDNPNKQVLVKVHVDAKNIYFSIEDNGEGIDGAYLDKIFDMFFRISADRSGSGLGLYIARQTVEKLNGNLKIESTPDQGTTANVTIPYYS